ncbi:MAG TPA: thiamine-phosphate kinase [Thermoanaerobaculia bacterium]|nr:thiamine-phosphate kinase [Thermoanaerobaculia bacterium]
MPRRESASPRRPLRDEAAFVAWLRNVADAGIGDDTAFLSLDGSFAWTVDTQHEGVHLPTGCDPAVAARRLLAVNLSDLAAVGAEPRYALLSLAAPPEYDRRRFVAALVAACARFRVRLLGGDTSRLDRLSATLTLIGRRPRRASWMRRSAARPGDQLFVGGTLGEAALGLALVRAGAIWERGRMVLPAGLEGPRSHTVAARRAVRRFLAPEPQMELSRRLSQSGCRVAAIDVSDGLGKDLARLCAASGVGAEVETLPLAQAAEELAARLGLNARELALGGGEDYVLLFTLPASSRQPAGSTPIGWIRSGTGVWAIEEGDRRRDIADAGFDHFAAR